MTTVTFFESAVTDVHQPHKIDDEDLEILFLMMAIVRINHYIHNMNLNNETRKHYNTVVQASSVKYNNVENTSAVQYSTIL